jgi:hypothetical protein
MSDGARDALAGYLYQIIGAFGLKARAIDGADEKSELLCTLFIEAERARVMHEVHGQDVLIRREEADHNSGVAVQFKFSRQATAEIPLNELRDILHAFDGCKKAASSEFPITDYVLITNRSLNQSASDRYEKRSTQLEQLPARSKQWLNPPQSKTEGISKEYGSVKAAIVNWYSVFQKLTVHSRVRCEHWKRGLKEYGRLRGMVAEEVDRGIWSTPHFLVHFKWESLQRVQ